MRVLTGYGIAAFVAMVLAVGFIATLAVGAARYGGPEALWLRVRAEVASLRPHPQFVPTPLPTPTGRTGNAFPFTSVATAAPEQTRPETLIVSPEAQVVPSETATPQPSATPTASPTPVHRPAGKAVQLTGITHAWQRWNNCGPATLAMYLSCWGDAPPQEELAAVLKGNPDDKNVSPEEIVDYAISQGYHAMVRVNGDLDRVRLFLSNGLAVMIESWLEEEPNDGMGHYRLVTGYDDAAQQATLYDSYVSRGVRSDQPYQGILIDYDEMLSLWAVFNHTYILIYTTEQEAVVLSILGEDAENGAMWRRALQQSEAEVEAKPHDPFVWFNLGTSLVALERYDEAVEAYARARQVGLPWRMLWYQFGPFHAYYETGLYEELLALAEATIRTGGYVEEIYYWKGLGLTRFGKLDQAKQAWREALELNPRYEDAARSLAEVDRSTRKLPLPAQGGSQDG